MGAVFEGVGAALGSFIGGRLYETYGGWKTFRWFGTASLIFCIVHIIAQYLIKDKSGHTGLAQGKKNATGWFPAPWILYYILWQMYKPIIVLFNLVIAILIDFLACKALLQTRIWRALKRIVSLQIKKICSEYWPFKNIDKQLLCIYNVFNYSIVKCLLKIKINQYSSQRAIYFPFFFHYKSRTTFYVHVILYIYLYCKLRMIECNWATILYIYNTYEIFENRLPSLPQV